MTTAPKVLAGAEAFRFDGGPIGFVLQHGFTGAPASMRPFGQWLHQHGVMAVGPRLPGHGTTWEDLDTTVWRDWEREAEAALLDVASNCSTVVACGLSMGGAMVVHLAAKHPEKIHGVIVINPLIRRSDLLFTPMARLFTKSIKGVGNDIKKPGQDELVYDRVPLRAATELGRLIRTADKELPSVRQPLLIFSSPEDHTVKPFNSRRVLQRAGSTNKELVRLANSYHVATLDYDADLIFERSLAFAKGLAGTPAPS